MVDLTASARRLYRRIVRPSSEADLVQDAAPEGTADPNAFGLDAAARPAPAAWSGAPRPGHPAEATGLDAAAVIESWVSDAAGLFSPTAGTAGPGLASFPADAATRRFRLESRHDKSNLFARPTMPVEAASGRGALAAALGLAATGRRATAFLSGPEMTASLDLLGAATRQRLPLVIHLAARAGGDALGGGHEAINAAAQCGVVVLVAVDVQEAADLTLIARRLAEDALVPVVLAMDGVETGLATQDLLLPEASLMRAFLGRPEEDVHPPTPAQAAIFGQHRRRVPRWHDPELPLMHGAARGPEAFAVASASRHAFFDAHLPALFEHACNDFARMTGRRYGALRTHATEKADVLLLAQGAAVETAEAAADHLCRAGIRAGTVGILLPRPFPTAELAELLNGRQAIAVLERSDAPTLGQTPLMTDIRALLHDAPSLVSVRYGLGGQPLRGRDLVALGHTLAHHSPGPGGADESSQGFQSLVDGAPLYLGLQALADDPDHPKRQALADALERAYPDLSRLGLRSLSGPPGSEPPDLRPKGSLTLSVHHLAGRGGEHLSGEAALLLRRLAVGSLRCRPAQSFERWGAELVDTMTWCPTGSKTPLRDPGDDVAADVTVWLPLDFTAWEEAAGRNMPGPLPAFLERLRAGGALLLPGEPANAWGRLPVRLRQAIEGRRLRLYAVGSLAPGKDSAAALLREERLLGALFQVLHAEGRAEVALRKLLKARRDLLEEHGAEDVDARLDELQAGFEGVAPVDVETTLKPLQTGRELGELPPIVRRLGRGDAPLADLAGFWSRAGVLYREGKSAELSPDPFLATASLPPLTAALRGAPPREVMPEYDPARCTGCGDCWSACPDGAIGPAALGAAALLDFAMERARAAGHAVDKLRMVSSKLAQKVEVAAARDDFHGGLAGELFDAAFTPLVDKLKMPEERKTAIREAYAAVREAIAELPLAHTAPFFEDDGKNLFTLAINPDACKGCGLCIASCEPAALSELPDDAKRGALARGAWHLHEALPEASRTTLESAREHVGPLAGALLMRAARQAMAAGDGAEAGSGESLALRQALGAAVFHLAPRGEGLLAQVRKLREKLTTAIHDDLAHALPDRDLDALAAGLETLEQPDVDLRQLTDRVEAVFETGRVDVPRTRRRVEAARRLSDLEWRLTKGEGGLGRTPLGLVIAPGAPLSAAAVFPHNPFAVPVAVDTTGDAAELARGLVEGQLAQAVEAIRTLRRGRLELENPARAARADDELAALGWRDLEADERRFCPPLLVLASEEALSGAGLAGFLAALGSDLPLKIIVLTDPISDDSSPLPRGEGPGVRAPLDLARLALTQPAFVAQSSIAAGDDLEQSLAAALEFDGPALLRVHAPSPARHGFASDAALEHARRALDEGDYELFRSDPNERRDPAATASAVAPAPGSAESNGDGTAELMERHAAELAALRADYEARLQNQRTSLQSEMAQRVRGRLLELALRAPRRDDPAAAEEVSS